MGRRSLNERQPAKNIGVGAPTRSVTTADGLVREEKLCPIPCSEKMVSPAGNVVTVPFATGYTIRGINSGNPYGVQKRPEKLKKGFLPYNHCPVAKSYVKLGKNSKPCEGDDGHGTFKAETCCKHIEEIIERRRTQMKKRMKQVNDRFATQSDRIIEIMRKEHNIDPSRSTPVATQKGLPG